METNLIRQAMQQIQTDMGDNCIRFQEFTTPAPPAGKYVVITRNGGLTGYGKSTKYCNRTVRQRWKKVSKLW